MRLAMVLATGMLLALPSNNAAAGKGGIPHDAIPPGTVAATDAIAVACDQAVVHASNAKVVLTVAAADADAPAVLRPRASLIIYAPDGTMLKARPRSLHSAQARFPLWFGRTPQLGTYTVYATVEAGAQAFGIPTTFEVAGD